MEDCWRWLMARLGRRVRAPACSRVPGCSSVLPCSRVLQCNCAVCSGVVCVTQLRRHDCQRFDLSRLSASSVCPFTEQSLSPPSCPSAQLQASRLSGASSRPWLWRARSILSPDAVLIGPSLSVHRRRACCSRSAPMIGENRPHPGVPGLLAAAESAAVHGVC